MVSIRRAEEGDLPFVAAMEAAEFSRAPDRASLERMLGDGRHVFLLAEEDAAPAGCAWYEYVLDEGYVGDLTVAPAYRRRGLGALLTEAMIADARERGLAFLTLEVRASNAAARRLYERCGFQTVGVRKNYYEKPAEDAVLMTYWFKEAELC